MQTRQAGTSVHLAGLNKTFGGVTQALADFDLQMKPGEMVVLLGPSGCGKTTALRALAGLEDVDSGRIIVGGEDVTALPTSKRDMAMVFQSYSLFPHLTAQENVEFGLRVRKVPADMRRRQAMETLDMVGLADQATKYTHQMSGGQQQRVALARALVVQPKVLLLDEPLSALDAKVRLNLREEIRRIQIESGITTLFVTHDQEEALAVADRVGVMYQGKLAQLAAPTDIYSQPANEFVATFIGSTNRLPGRTNDAGTEAIVWNQVLPLLPGSAVGEVRVLVRPESISLRLATGDATVDGDYCGQVQGVSFLGSQIRVTVLMEAGQADGRTCEIQLPADWHERYAVGDLVELQLKPQPALAV